jgi:glycosyltransferase involved in cell wall biosynthesis
MISVIIPALDEERTIGKVVRFCYLHPLVTEVIVVDDNSADKTVEKALYAGAKVIHSAKRGKGISMKEGIASSQNEIIAFLDGDIDPYPMDTIDHLVQPILQGDADFVKGAFDRNAGRVTELVARPLLSLLYPDLATFNQPLGGMIAGRKMLFEQIDFLHDYGVDIGILIDMHQMQAKIIEVNIGFIRNKSKPWNSLAKMSTEVTSAIIGKALSHKSPGNFPATAHATSMINKAGM